MSDTVRVSKVNEVFLKVDCDDGLAKELFEFFSFKVPNAKFMPSFRNRMWDGKVYLFSIKTHKIYIGLLPYVDEFCRERGYEFEGVEDILGTKQREKCSQSWLADLKLPFEPREYQIDAFNTAIQYGRQLLLSPTASGKSLIIYLLARYYNKKTVIIVPTTSLVEQMSKDFVDYGYKEPICKIYHGQPVFDAPITITTWQSFSKAPKKTLESFDMVVGDEAHLFKAKSLTSVMSKLKNCRWKFGTTGTLDDSQTHKLILEGLFGPVFQVTQTKDLIDAGYLAQFNIQCIVFRYTQEEKLSAKKFNYQDEISFLINHEKRNKFIRNLACDQTGNTLLLYQFVEKHGEILYNIIQEKVNKDRKVFFVHGGVDGSDREEIRRITEQERDAIIIASFGTFSTGINIRNLHNIIFASPSKSKIRNLQSIGRGLRKGSKKEEATLYDISDDLSYKTYTNYTLKHFKERISQYNEQQFKYRMFHIGI